MAAQTSEAGAAGDAIDLDFQRREIARLREKLLDLTRRNGLLNFSHARSGAFARVIDELPDQLFAALRAGEMAFEPLPDPETEPADERTESFQNAMAIARLTDETYLAAIAELGETEADTETLAALDEALRHRVRAQLNLPKLSGGRRLDIAELARANGFDPSFDLPKASQAGPEFDAATPEHLGDDAIRILLTASQADRRLRTIFDRNRTLENETGIHTLQIAFGFVEWRDPKQPSAGPYHAPLLMMPLHFRRKIVNGSYRFWASAPEGELSVNLALAELLKRDHGVALPDIGAEATPEAYFAAIAPLLEAAKFLALRRFVTIAVFPFPRMGLWVDLDETIWPNDGLVAHRGLARLIGGLATEGAAGSFGVDHPIEDPAFKGRVPPLVMPADVSQHSAILDAIEGKDLVVEGPPGTGKSQTIANLVAAAIGAGRRVLFLAEKRTALEAVAKRLRERGLGPALLELHSDKTSKPEVMASLKEALENDVAMPARLAALRDGQKRDRAVLTDYLTALQERPDGHDATVWSLVWSETALRDRLAGRMAETIRPADVAGVELADEGAFRRAADTLAELAKAAEAVEEDLGGLTASPWHAARGLPVQPHAQEALVRDLSAGLGTALAAARDAAAALPVSAAPAPLVGRTAPELAALCDALAALVLPADDGLAAAALEGALTETVLGAAERLAETRAHREELANGAGDAAGLKSLQALEERLLADGFTRVALADLAERAEAFRADAGRFEALASRLAPATEALGPDFPANAETARQLSRLAAIRRTYSDLAWSLQIPVANKRRREHLDRLGDRSRDVQERLKRLSAEIDMAKASEVPTAELRRLAETLGGTGALGRLFGGEFKRAMTAAQTLAPRVTDRDRLRQLLADAATLLDEWSEIAGDAEGQSAFGAAWRGPQTAFDALDDAAACLGEVGGFLSRNGGDHRLRAVLSLPPEALDGLSLSAEEAALIERCDDSAALTMLADGLRARAEALGALERDGRGCGVAADAPILDHGRRLSQTLAALEADIAALVNGAAPEQRAAIERASKDLDAARTARAMAAAPVLVDAFGPDPAKDGIMRLDEIRTLQGQAGHLAERLADLRAAGSAVRERLGPDFVPSSEAAGLSARAETLSAAIADTQGLRLHANLSRYIAEAEAQGLKPLYDRQVRDGQPVSALPDILSLLRCQQALEAIFADPASPIGRTTTGRLDTARGRFKAAEIDLYRLEADAILSKARERARTAPWGNDSGPIRSYTEMALVQNEIAKQSRHIPIRQLIERAGTALQALKPVLMMSPHALAQYAPPGTLDFDLVVIDEASQMKPEFSIGALARGAQYVIVGDQKQLPPTDFFSGQEEGDEAEDEAGAADNAESILDLASARIPHKRRLRWHYRSQHPALIAYSNREFYDRELVIFPAATEDDVSGVSCIEVDGIYQANVNPAEAERVIAEARALIYRTAEDGRDLSLGIATMNLKQRELINAEFERLAARDPIVRAYVERWEKTVEPVFVKNLENVQGDERDVVIISTLFGPSEAGQRPKQNFGAINRAAGHRRLNVLFTRAKRAMIVVTSLKTGDIVPTASSSRGVHVFKGFLDYARGGAVYDDATGREADSPFETFVAARLKAAGYDVVHQIGVEGFRIDLGVRHPADPTVFIAGIECDGAPFHTGLTIRDRDMIRQQVLEGLGWAIVRIWSTDWYNDPDGEARKLIRFLGEREAAVHVAPRAEPALSSDASAEPDPDIPEETGLAAAAARPPADPAAGSDAAEAPARAVDRSEATPAPEDEAAPPAAEPLATEGAPIRTLFDLAPSEPAADRGAADGPPARDATDGTEPAAPSAPPPRGRHIRRNALDIYEVLPGLFEIRRDGRVLGEVERVSGVGVDRRLTAGSTPSLPRFRGTPSGSDVTFTTTDIYEAFDRIEATALAETE
ncbi:DUF4011 domain-containing protein [Jiella sp. M17.18]|uniref:DUF4011 domain-containing protein n=1 Tax=Jiella sp. M17.18 TaxID=3234247 RepID=UPI0034DED412